MSNFSRLNFLTGVLAVSIFSDATLGTVIPVAAPTTAAAPLFLTVAALLVTALVLVLILSDTST